MWSNLVWIAEAVLNHAIFRFVEIFWRYPLVGAAFLAAFLVLSALLWLEVLKDASAASQAATRARSSSGEGPSGDDGIAPPQRRHNSHRR